MVLFTPSNRDQRGFKTAGSLGPRRRSLAFLAVLTGLLTFFLPIVSTDPEVMGIAHWSVWNISWQIYEGNLLPNRDDLLSSIPMMPLAILVLLFLAFVVLCVSPSSRTLTKIAATGCFTGWFWRGDRISFEELFYGNVSHDRSSLIQHVGSTQLTILLLASTGSLLFVATNERWDSAETPRYPQLGNSRESGFLDIEILPPEKKKPDHRDDPPRLRHE